MTKAQRKQAIVDCQARLYEAENEYEEAHKAYDKAFFAQYTTYIGERQAIYKAKRRLDEAHKNLWTIRNEYRELTKYKAWCV